MPDDEVIALINSELESYWSQQNLEPTALVNGETFAKRIGDLLGNSVEIDPVQPVDSIRESLQSELASRAAGHRLAEQMLGRVGRGRLSKDQRNALADVFAESFGGSKRFDLLASELVSARGSTAVSSREFNPKTLWLAALAGPRSVPMVEQFGHAMLDVDLRCARCHDHPLDGRVWQGQYWGLTAAFETGLRWSTSEAEGLQLQSADPQLPSEQPVVFYELADGRQRVAKPFVPVTWFAGSEAVPEADSSQGSGSGQQAVRWVAASMRDNPQVAKAAVNQVWAMVYGAPLVGSAANPSLPAESAITLRLQNQLAAQFRAYDFDMSRLLAWVASARPMWLSVPATYRSPQFELASSQELLAAELRTRAFAAFPHSIPKQTPGN